MLLDLFKYLYNLRLQEHPIYAHCRQKGERKRKEKERENKYLPTPLYSEQITLLHLGNGYCDVNVKNVIKRVRPTANVNAAK